MAYYAHLCETYRHLHPDCRVRIIFVVSWERRKLIKKEKRVFTFILKFISKLEIKIKSKKIKSNRKKKLIISLFIVAIVVPPRSRFLSVSISHVVCLVELTFFFLLSSWIEFFLLSLSLCCSALCTFQLNFFVFWKFLFIYELYFFYFYYYYYY